MTPAINKSSRLCTAVRPSKLLFHYQLPIELQFRLYATKVKASSAKQSGEYLEVVDKPSTRMDAQQLENRKKQLLILDLNGTLLSRTNRRNGMYVRPHIQTFLDYIFDHFRVMVWSSAQKTSVKHMMKFFREENMKKMTLVWDRSHFGLSKADFNNKAPTIKDLNKIWNKDNFRHFNASNTVILDDSPSKCVLQPFNGIHLPTFDHNDPAFLENGDHILLSVMDYLKRIEQQTNISNFIRHTPYIFTPMESDTRHLDKSCDYYSFTSSGPPLTCDFSVQQPARD